MKKLFLSVGLSVLVLAGVMSVISLRANAAKSPVPSVSIVCNGSDGSCSIQSGKDITLKVNYSNVTSCSVYEGVDNTGVLKQNFSASKTGEYKWTVKQAVASTSYYVTCRKINGDVVTDNVASDSVSVTIRPTPTPTPTRTPKTPTPTPSSAPKITVKTPNGGERLQAGRQYVIEWKSSGTYNTYIDLLKDNSPYMQIEGGNSYPAGNNSFSWTVQPITEAGNNYKIRIMSGDDQSIVDTSDKNFIVVPSVQPVIKVLSPSKGESVYPNRIYNVQWTINKATDIKSLFLQVSKYGKGLIYFQGRNPIPKMSGKQSWPWYPGVVGPMEDGNDYQITINAIGADNQILASASTDNFSIINYPDMPSTLGTLKIIRPNDGKNLQVDKNYSIRWQWKPADNNNTMLSKIQIELIPEADYPEGRRLLAERTDSSGTYNWVPSKTQSPDPAVDSPIMLNYNYRIRVSGIVLNKTANTDTAEKQRNYYFASDVSDAPFMVVPKQSTAALIGNFFADILSAPFQYIAVP